MTLTTSGNLASPEATTPGQQAARVTRCCITERSGRGPVRTGQRPCPNEEIDPGVGLCAHHLATAVRDYCRLTGGKLTILGGRTL